MKVRKILLLAAAMLFVVVVAPSEAVTIRNVTTDTLLFQDDFEGVTPVSHAAFPDYSGDYDPDNGAYPGSWVANYWVPNNDYPERVQVTDYSVPGPFEGNQYLRVVGNAADPGSVSAMLDTAQADNSDVIHIEFMRYIPTDFGRPQFYLWEADAGVTLNLLINYNGGGKLISFISHSNKFEITETTYALDTWQKWELDFSVDTATFDLTIDGVSEYDIPRIGSGAFETATFYDYTGEHYIDAVSGSGEPIPGDANLDDVVNDADASILAAHWQQTSMGWGDGDFNGDTVVNDADASILAAHWQENRESTAPVPEPSTIVLLAFAAVTLLIWRRWK